MPLMIPGSLTRILTRFLTAPWSRSVRGSAASGATVHAHHLRAMATVIVCSALLLSACSTGKQAQTRFYVLDSMPAGVSALDGATRDPPLAVNIAALRLPQYLERPQIVTRSANTSAGRPASAPRPAERTSTTHPACASFRRTRASAIGLRQMFPIQRSSSR